MHAFQFPLSVLWSIAVKHFTRAWILKSNPVF